MGIFDFLKKKAHKKEEPQAELWDSRELNQKIASFEKGEMQKFYTEIENLRKELGPKLTEVKNLAVSLEKSKISEDIDKRLLIRIESSRRNLVNRTKNACDFFFERKLKQVDGIESLNKLLETSSHVFSQMNEVGGKYAEVSSLGFSSAIADLERSIKSANDLFKKLVKLSEENRKCLESISTIKSDAEKLELEIKRVDEGKKEIELLQNENKKIQEKETELLNKKDKLEQSSAYKAALMLKENLEKSEKEKSALKRDFRNEFLLFKKPLQKYLYTFGAGLSKEMYSRLEKYLDEPLDALIADESMDIEHALSKICEFAKENKLKFEPKEKICSEISKMLEQKKLFNTLKKYKDLEGHINSLKDEIAKSILGESEQISKDIEKVKSEINVNNRRIELADKAMLAAQENITKLKSGTEKIIKSDFDKNIRIN